MEVKFLSGKSEDSDYIRVPFHSYEKMVEWSQKNPESGCWQKSVHVLKRFFGAASQSENDGENDVSRFVTFHTKAMITYVAIPIEIASNCET